MTRVLLMLAFLTLFSCKEQPRKLTMAAVETEFPKVAENYLSTDTIFFNYDDKLKLTDYALAHLMEKEYDKDSICKGFFKIEFKERAKTVYSKTIEIDAMDEGSEWNGSSELSKTASPLKSIGYGYPACGYGQNNFLFYVNGQNSALIHRWQSAGDSGWGNWSEVVSGSPEDFYFRSQSFEPLEDADGNDADLGINNFSDSIHFKLQGDKWKKTFKTPKGRVYRSRKISFDEFYKQD